MEIDEQEYIAFIRENVKEEENIKEKIKKEKAKLMGARLNYKNVSKNNWVDTLMKYKNQRKITKTGEVYKAYNGFTDDYDGKRYKTITDDMYTKGISGYIEK